MAGRSVDHVALVSKLLVRDGFRLGVRRIDRRGRLAVSGAICKVYVSFGVTRPGGEDVGGEYTPFVLTRSALRGVQNIVLIQNVPDAPSHPRAVIVPLSVVYDHHGMSWAQKFIYVPVDERECHRFRRPDIDWLKYLGRWDVLEEPPELEEDTQG